MGFVFKHLGLILVLISITIILGLPFKVISPSSFVQLITTFFISMFINGLPEELFFRGYLLPRLEAVLKNPIHALVISAILFNMSHIPSHISNGMSIHQALLMSFSIAYPTGLILGYLYLKTRSIVPGIIWHTSNTILGIVFINYIPMFFMG
ncbi:CPBP family intramembrane glutamic endopeptidase [Microbacteriaceae bacterium 4G12]